MRLLSAMAAVAVVVIQLAALAHADPDSDFATRLHGDGIYGPRDFVAWLGKISCERLATGLDASPYQTVHFVSANLPDGTDTAQSWQFLATAIDVYCPQRRQAIDQISMKHP